MGKWLERLSTSSKPLLWLDDTTYSTNLLAGGAAPWLDVPALVAWRGKAQSLLRSDVAVLDVAALCGAWIAHHSSIRERMAEQRRATAPLRAQLGDESLRRHLLQSISALRASTSLPFAITMSSPRLWVSQAYRVAFSETLTAGEDETDSASVYLADFLRAFGESGIDVLLLSEDADTTPARAELEWYQSVINVARHYRWDLGLRSPRASIEAASVDFVIAPEGARGLMLGDAFWSAGEIPQMPLGGFFHVKIPPDTQPELVLERLALLR